MDRLISEKAVLDAIADHIRSKSNIAKLIVDIQAIPSADKWISVSERLPKLYDEEVMVTTRCGEISKATLRYEAYRTDAEEKGLYNWRFRNCDTSFDFVTAWMPLPEPYKEG